MYEELEYRYSKEREERERLGKESIEMRKTINKQNALLSSLMEDIEKKM
jgi:hypothetical protein